METQAAINEQPLTTADRILDAAEDLFAEKGYSATSLGDVADRVGIRSPSLYNHFRNKEALYEAVLERLLEEFSAPLEELGSKAAEILINNIEAETSLPVEKITLDAKLVVRETTLELK